MLPLLFVLAAQAALSSDSIEESGFIALMDLVESEETPRDEEVKEEFRRDPDLCGASFEEFITPAGLTAEEVRRLAEAARSAVVFSKLEPCRSRVAVVASPWQGMDVLRIEHGSCFSLSLRHVAVDRDGKGYLLTGDLQAGDGPSAAKEALRNFEGIGGLENVRIGSAEEAAEYLSFVLDTFQGGLRGISLPDRKSADYIAGGRMSVELRAFAQASMAGPSASAVEVLGETEDGWMAEAFTWKYWCGAMAF